MRHLERAFSTPLCYVAASPAAQRLLSCSPPVATSLARSINQSNMIVPTESRQWTIRERKLTKRKLSQVELRDLRRSTLEKSHNLFEVLLSVAGGGTVEATIPECMMQVIGQLNPALMYTDAGAVRLYKGSHAFNKFFEMVDLRLSSQPRKEHDVLTPSPQYIVFSRDKSARVCMTKEESIAVWRSNNSYLVRRFVRSEGNKATVFRVNYQRERGTCSVLAIKNATQQGSHTHLASLNLGATTPTSHSSIYQHDIFSFVYAGKLLKASFSPYNPYPSLLHSHFAKSPPRTAYFSPRSPRQYTQSMEKRGSINCGKSSAYYVDTRSLEACKVYHVTEKVPALEAEVAKFVASLQRTVRGKTVKEVDLEFIRSPDEGYVLVDLISLAIEPLAAVSSQTSSVRQAFRKLNSRGCSSPQLPSTLLFPPFVERPLTRTSDRCYKNFLTNSAHSYRSSDPGVDLGQFAVSELQGVEEKYDSLMGRVRRAKSDHRDIAAELDEAYGPKNGADALVDRFFRAFIEREEVGKLYENKMKQDFELMKAGITAVLRGQTSLTARRRMRAAHKSIEHLDHLAQVFCSVAAKEAAAMSLSPEHCELVASRLAAFLHELRGGKA